MLTDARLDEAGDVGAEFNHVLGADVTRPPVWNEGWKYPDEQGLCGGADYMPPYQCPELET